MRSIYLVIAVLLLSLFGIVTSDVGIFAGLSLEARRAIALTAFAVNIGIGLYGAIVSHRMLWIVYLVLSVVGLVLVGATTPIVALWAAVELVVG